MKKAVKTNGGPSKIQRVPLEELLGRMKRFRAQMDARHPEWEMAAILGRINQYYFTGTMQDGLLLIPREGGAVLWARRSYERAVAESLFQDIRPMESFRDAAASLSKMPRAIGLETELVPLALYQRFQKYFSSTGCHPIDDAAAAVRSVKSGYELDLMRRAGEIHRRVMEERVPEIIRAGASEAEMAVDLYRIMIEEGHHGVARFGAFGVEAVIGYICFGESSLYPTNFNGPGGGFGMSPATPLLGSREHKLKKGQLVFIDIACGVEGYHTDKTLTYLFGRALCPAERAAHDHCVDIQDEIAAMLKPGAIPSEIYKNVLARQNAAFLENFMGFGRRRVKFLGHGIGLVVDESPVIAEGFDEPLEEGMVLAVEPKKGIAGLGMVGIENTFLVTPKGGECLTGPSRGMIAVNP